MAGVAYRDSFALGMRLVLRGRPLRGVDRAKKGDLACDQTFPNLRPLCTVLSMRVSVPG